jgi:hypothetical protein
MFNSNKNDMAMPNQYSLVMKIYLICGGQFSICDTIQFSQSERPSPLIADA